MTHKQSLRVLAVSRRTGGLEKSSAFFSDTPTVSRRTGGLETAKNGNTERTAG